MTSDESTMVTGGMAEPSRQRRSTPSAAPSGPFGCVRAQRGGVAPTPHRSVVIGDLSGQVSAQPAGGIGAAPEAA